jgi:two-component system, NtrC family, sensor kinase
MSKILVVEDDSTTRLFLKRDLQLEGYQVVVAKDGAEGLLQAQQLQPNLIICDWVMPLMDGVEVCRQVKANPQLATTFFILLTSREAIADRVAGLDAGADEFLSKPIDPKELQARVRAGLRQYQLTQELSQANQQLSLAMQELQQTQTRLIQSEKMSSLGQMVAGMAHEINNPVTFIYGNLSHASIYIQNLLDLVSLYQKHYPNPDAEIKQQATIIDLDFLAQDLPNLLSSMKTGAQRIYQIVQDLRNFSRLDEAEIKLADLHEGIDNTLNLLKHRLHSNGNGSSIQIIKEYGNIPVVECYPKQLNQVFLNILTNAIDFLEEETEPSAIDSSQESAPLPTSYSPLPTIRIHTEVLDNNIQIKIADNGPGMTAEVNQKLFDPFFTTKPVGKGTGMGLSISYQIVVQRHGGQLRCISKPGQGAEFIIEIPLHQIKN